MDSDQLPIDFESVELLKQVQFNLASALNSLSGKSTEGRATYLVDSATHVNKAVGGYVLLREARMLHASKILVRPVLETAIYLRATMRNSEFILCKAYSEMLEDEKFDAPSGTKRKSIEKAAKHSFQQFQKDFLKADSSCTLLEPKEVTVRSAAESTGLGQAYLIDYRLYCQFTHGALRAMSGQLDDLTDQRDTPLMIWCALIVCEELANHTPAKLGDLARLWKNLQQLPPPRNK